ncbi:PREDICTED: repetin-like [Tinamus guttatus]|uniref:repetin-like n=1 Tax=Tinamus guttatus TaxID=94827 RepID=UPI00052F06C0|nr:PREDICTED: repetin-like [Tinamus guttatus]
MDLAVTRETHQRGGPPQVCREMAQLQENVLGIISTFWGDGDRGAPSKEELRRLVQHEVADAVANPRRLETAEKVLGCLDDDDRVDFNEFLALVFHVAKACYKELRKGQALGRGQEATVQAEACREDEQAQGAEPPDTPQTQEAPDEEPEAPQAEGTEVLEGDPKRREILDLETAEQNRNTRPAEENGAPKQDPDTQETEGPEQGPNNHQAPDAETQENTSSSLQALEMESAEQDLSCPSEPPVRDASSEMQVCAAPQQDPEPSKTHELQLPEQGESPGEGAKPQETHQDPPLHRSHEPEAPERELGSGDVQF